MKLFSILVSILAASSSVSGRPLMGNDTKTWSPIVTDPCIETTRHVEDFVYVCGKLPDEYKDDCEKTVTFPYPPQVICEALKNLEPEEKVYWLAFFR